MRAGVWSEQDIQTHPRSLTDPYFHHFKTNRGPKTYTLPPYQSTHTVNLWGLSTYQPITMSLTSDNSHHVKSGKEETPTPCQG